MMIWRHQANMTTPYVVVSRPLTAPIVRVDPSMVALAVTPYATPLVMRSAAVAL
jgi:hypothetical protein